MDELVEHNPIGDSEPVPGQRMGHHSFGQQCGELASQAFDGGRWQAGASTSQGRKRDLTPPFPVEACACFTSTTQASVVGRRARKTSRWCIGQEADQSRRVDPPGVQSVKDPAHDRVLARPLKIDGPHPSPVMGSTRWHQRVRTAHRRRVQQRYAWTRNRLKISSAPCRGSAVPDSSATSMERATVRF